MIATPLKFSRVFAMPSAATFTIAPIKEVLGRYVGDGQGWADAFAGFNSPAYWTNDLNPDAPTRYHMRAEDFCLTVMPTGLRGFIFDPPYSPTQIKEHYTTLGVEAEHLDMTANFYSRIKAAVAPKIKVGGFVICCGWNTIGFGRAAGYEMIEVLAVNHGGWHNDTLVTVEVKR